MRTNVLSPVPCALFLLSFVAGADTISQSDWSGGPGVPGPVSYWGSEFSIDTGISWYGTYGYVELLPGDDYLIDDAFSGVTMTIAADLDGDGDSDVIGCNSGNDDIVLWRNANGIGTSWTEQLVDGSFDGVSGIAAGDIDGDGDMDIVAAATNADDMAWWANADGLGGSWVKHTIDPNFNGARSTAVADIDGDGDLDVLGAAWNANDIALWRNLAGTGLSWQKTTINSEFGRACWVSSADVDGDGDVDVLGAARMDDDISWFQNMNGSGSSWTERLVDGGFDGARCVHAADLDGDGDIDILGAAENSNDVCWWENTAGTGLSWTEWTIDGSYGGARAVSTGDIDGDGDLDVLGAAYTDDDITWWESTGSPVVPWVEHSLDADMDGAISVCSAHIDTDASLDVLGAAADAGDVAWWSLSAYPENGSMESSILELPQDPGWGVILWTSVLPSGCSVKMQVRASEDPANMGAWSDTLSGPTSLSGILDTGDRYVQYRAILLSTNPAHTPGLNDITITYDPLGAPGGPGAPRSWELMPVSPNPCSSQPVIGFAVPEAGRVELSVFDLSGRLACFWGGDFEPGFHYVQTGILRPGIYFCRMTADGFEASERFAVIER